MDDRPGNKFARVSENIKKNILSFNKAINKAVTDFDFSLLTTIETWSCQSINYDQLRIVMISFNVYSCITVVSFLR